MATEAPMHTPDHGADKVAALPTAGPVRVIAVTSGKGGVGKTTVSINLAMAFADRGRDVMLMDADLGLANIDVMLGLKPASNLSHVIDGTCSIQDVVVTGPRGVRILPGASGIRRMAELAEREQAGLIYAFSSLTPVPQVLIVDTSAGIGAPAINFCAAAQEVVLVVCNEPTSLADAYAMIKVLSQEGGRSRFRVLVNMARTAADGQLLFQKLVDTTNRFLDVSLDLFGTIPYDGHVLRSIQNRRALLDAFPASGTAQVFKKLAERADRWPAPKTASGQLEFFVESVIRAAPASGKWARA
ncbi:MAG: MinD/ParA family protein [Chromatiales bacterium]